MRGRYVEIKTGSTYQWEHRIIAEQALGKSLPESAVVHHLNGYDPEHKAELVICQDQGYHQLLHARERALKTCGHVNWRICRFCHKYDKPENLYLAPRDNGAMHRACHATYERERRKKIKEK